MAGCIFLMLYITLKYLPAVCRIKIEKVKIYFIWSHILKNPAFAGSVLISIPQSTSFPAHSWGKIEIKVVDYIFHISIIIHFNIEIANDFLLKEDYKIILQSTAEMILSEIMSGFISIFFISG